jgi:hypothetical protein
MFPSTVKVTKLNAQQPEYASLRGAYDDFSTLYEGGKAIRDRVTQFLRKRPKELSDVYTVRQQNFSYTNLLGNIVGWYEAALFKQAPQIVKKQAGATGDAALKIPGEVETFCAGFEKDCDQGGTSFVDFWPQVLESLLLYRSAYVLVDLPGSDGSAPLSLGAQVQTGRLNPFLAAYDPTSVVNWECDAAATSNGPCCTCGVSSRRFSTTPSRSITGTSSPASRLPCTSAKCGAMRTAPRRMRPPLSPPVTRGLTRWPNRSACRCARSRFRRACGSRIACICRC